MQIKQLIVAKFFTMPRFQFPVIAAQGKGFAEIPLNMTVAGVVNDCQSLGRGDDEMVKQLAHRLTRCEEMLGPMRDVAGDLSRFGVTVGYRMRLDRIDHAPVGRLGVDDENRCRRVQRKLPAQFDKRQVDGDDGKVATHQIGHLQFVQPANVMRAVQRHAAQMKTPRRERIAKAVAHHQD